MGGFDDHVAIMGDWMPPSPSPRALFSSVLGDDASSRPVAEHSGDNHSRFSFPEPIANHASTGSDQKDGSQIGAAVDQTGKFSSLSEQKMGNRGGLVERMAARAGFDAPRLNTESIRPADLSQSLEVRSPYITIPPGLSPTTLLDSPVFLSDSLAQPSPTTGKFGFQASGSGRNAAMAEFHYKRKGSFYENFNSGSFAFKPIPESVPLPQFGTSSRVTSTSLPQPFFPSMEVSVQSGNTFPTRTMEHPKAGAVNQQADFYRASTAKDSGRCDISSEPGPFNNVAGGPEHSRPFDEQQDEDADQRGCGDPNIGDAPAEDGYNWRKYGQKQVKGSEYPRSYYKCPHPNCPVKKKIERSQEGHITEIIYKGAHNHPKPAANRRPALGSLHTLGDMQLENGEQPGTSAADGDPDWATMMKGNGASDWRHENLEVTSSGSLEPEYCNGISSLQAQNGGQFQSGDAVDGSSTFSNDEDDEDRGTHNSVSLGYDGEGDESESKRRKVETCATDMSAASRAIREPRVVVQTTSEVDILDDGYRWRKYGQKVVKGNPNPRSYYKCTSVGCTVRKHVERASHDLKSVITTYEGKHNHDVPAARNSSHVNSGISGNLPVQATATVQSHVHRPEPSQLHSGMVQFERPPFGSFGLPGRPPLGPTTQGFGFGMNQQGLSSLTMAALGGANQGKGPVLPVQPYIGQQRPMNDMGPKGEPKLEPMSDPGLNLSNGASVYHQVLNRLPL